MRRFGRWLRERAIFFYALLFGLCSLAGLFVKYLLTVGLDSNLLFALLIIALSVVDIILTFRAYKRGLGS